MIIHAGWILEALGWQAVGLGMAAHQGIQKYRQNMNERQKREYFRPMNEWWAKYSISGMDAWHIRQELHRYNESSRSLREEIRATVVANITPDNEALEKMFWEFNHSKPYQLLSGIYANWDVVLYYALQGKVYDTDATIRFDEYPMGDWVKNKPEGFLNTIQSILTSKGIPDTYWLLEDTQQREKRLDEIWERNH